MSETAPMAPATPSAPIAHQRAAQRHRRAIVVATSDPARGPVLITLAAAHGPIISAAISARRALELSDELRRLALACEVAP